jgi:hypothetical protein
MTSDEAVRQLLDHVDLMVDYWSSVEGRSNVPPETTKREALTGLAFSLLVMLDGDALGVDGLFLAPIDESGEVGERINGYLHEQWSERRREFTPAVCTPNGYDPCWVTAINGALADRETQVRITDLDDDLWDRFVGPMIDAIDQEERPQA